MYYCENLMHSAVAVYMLLLRSKKI
jgi:hypothetical protein